MIFLKLAIITLTSLLYLACTESSVDVEDEVKETIPTIEGNFSLTPNVGGLRESVDVHINTGIWAKLSPGGRYSLYAKTDSLEVESFLFVDGVKCCEGGCRGVRDGDSLRYDFSCKVDEPTLVTLSLENENEEILKTSFHQVRLNGEGVYSDHLSLNLIVAGALGGSSDRETIDALAKNIGQSVQEIFEIKVDTVYVSYANEHPKVGYLYSKNSALFIQSLEDVFDLSESWNDSEKDNAFDIVLVQDFFNSSTMGQSRPFFMPVSFGVSLVVVSFRNIKNVQRTIVHELGHVLGLEHTTLTKNDLLRSGDYSLLDDGLDDTPFCQHIIIENNHDTEYCFANIMFPYSSMGGCESSPMQRAIVKKNLTLIPH